MSYRLNKTDGSLLIDLVDGEIDENSSDIVFVGRNYKGFGEFLNENFIKLLENFASTSAPEKPLAGQLWYNTNSGRLEVYDGSTFKAAGGPLVQSTFPNNPAAGELFINNQDNQLFFYDGTEWTLAGPIYTNGQGKTGFESVTILDTLGRSRIILKQYIQGTLIGIWSNIEFTPVSGSTIPGISSPIKVGFTPVSSSFYYNGTATNAFNLVTEGGSVKNINSFLPADSNGVTTGTITIQNTGGLTIGTAQNNVQKIVGTSVVTEMGLLDNDYKIRVRSSAFGSVIVDAVTVDASSGYVGIFNSAPEYTLDVTGDARISGNLLVEGDTTSIDVTTLRVEDKNIELGITSDSTLITDAAADGGGIILKVTGNDKTLTWTNATTSWTSSENLDIANGRTYKINGTSVLSSNALGSGITTASGLTEIGTLANLDVDNLNLNGNTITSATSGLNITTAGDITINNFKISGVATPTGSTDVATKGYVDSEINTQEVVLSLDVSGLTNADIAIIIQSMVAATSKAEGTFAFVSTTEFNNTTVTGVDVATATNKSFISVDSNGTQNESVLQDVNFDPASGAVNLTVTRGLKRYRVDTGVWVFDADLPTGL
jgi:hypothetical protein